MRLVLVSSSQLETTSVDRGAGLKLVMTTRIAAVHDINIMDGCNGVEVLYCLEKRCSYVWWLTRASTMASQASNVVWFMDECVAPIILFFFTRFFSFSAFLLVLSTGTYTFFVRLNQGQV